MNKSDIICLNRKASAHSLMIAAARTRMYQCPHSSGCQVRVSRKWFQRIVYSEVYLCTACGAFLGIHHRYTSALVVNNFCFVFSRYSHCVSCGSGAVDRGGRLYFPSINPLAWIQVLAAAPLRECSPCAPSYSAGSFRSCPGARRARIRTAPSHCPGAVRS